MWKMWHNPELSGPWLKKLLRRIVIALPLVAALLANLWPLTPRGHQFLVMITLIWFQVFILTEVLIPGK